MSPTLLSAFRPVSRDATPGRVAHPVAWTSRPADAGAAIAVLITGCRDAAAAVRGYKTVLPRARIVLYDSGADAEGCAAAADAGAEVRIVPAGTREALVRRMLAEVDADIYLLAHGAGADDVCLAPLVVAEVDGGKDFVDVRRFAEAPSEDAVERLLSRAVDFAFGGGGDMLRSDFKACSRRFALSYRGTAVTAGPAGCSARDLSLHALRLRLPVGRVAALATRDAEAAPTLDLAGRLGLLGLAARLLVEERPRRVFGLLGLGLVALALAVAAPDLKIHRWHATLVPGLRALAAGALLASGAVTGAAGLLLDTLAAARQEVTRLGVTAIPRRGDRPSGGR